MRKLSGLIFVVLLLAVSILAQTTSNNSTSKTSNTSTETKVKKKVFRATKDQITQAQKMLKEKGKYAGAEDGKYNDDFRASVKVFQEANGLRKSGSLNRMTLEKMGIALTDSQKEIPVNPNDLAVRKAVTKRRQTRSRFPRQQRSNNAGAENAQRKINVCGRRNRKARRPDTRRHQKMADRQRRKSYRNFK